MGVWDWALEVYGRPGVPQRTLVLQDEYGQNTSFLLWAVWARAESPELLAKGAELARRWDQTALQPIRAARRALKSPAPPVDDEAREALRSEIKALELKAERLLLETLERLSGSPTGKAAPLEALKAASRAWTVVAPQAPLAALAAALD